MTKARLPKYAWPHQRARATAARSHHPSHRCTRCGQPLGPMSRALHYDHDETGGYLGFAHARCNLRAGAAKGAATSHARALSRQHGLPHPQAGTATTPRRWTL
jgi:hypothetical protein